MAWAMAEALLEEVTPLGPSPDPRTVCVHPSEQRIGLRSTSGICSRGFPRSPSAPAALQLEPRPSYGVTLPTVTLCPLCAPLCKQYRDSPRAVQLILPSKLQKPSPASL